MLITNVGKKIKKHPNRACRAKKKSKERVDRSAAYVIDCTYPFVVTGWLEDQTSRLGLGLGIGKSSHRSGSRLYP